MSSLVEVIPFGHSGPWSIEPGHVIDGRAYRLGADDPMPPGCRILFHSQRGIVMSDAPHQVMTLQPGIAACTGRVLVCGLGLGVFLAQILMKPDVESIVVMEVDRDVIALVWPAFQDSRATLIIGDASSYPQNVLGRFDAAFIDIWDTDSGRDLQDRDALLERWKPWASRVVVWGHERARSNAEAGR